MGKDRRWSLNACIHIMTITSISGRDSWVQCRLLNADVGGWEEIGGGGGDQTRPDQTTPSNSFMMFHFPTLSCLIACGECS